ncbi:hypothetical protein [Antribacter gilvus]|uniref:hypothetical protein n=1 Tax=Antribacter gilvus TaxID=2304675 RepID=UPI000F773377|nr:hypothetical protein [Antribacter gilvus]
MLAGAVPPLSKRLIDRLSATTSRDEIATLHDAAVRHPNRWGRLLAMRVLGRRGDVARLPAVAEVVASTAVGFDRRMARDYLRELPPEISLPLARRWITAADHRVDAAHDIMSRHAEAQDVPAVRDVLGTADDYGTICSLVDALGRVPEAGPYPELDRIYSDSAYSYARWRAARAMAIANPQFTARWAGECLWDCEPATREIGVRFAEPMLAALPPTPGHRSHG